MDEMTYTWAFRAMLVAGIASLWGMIRKTARQTCELYAIHLGPNALDADGAPKWYVRQALTENVRDLTEAIRELHDVMVQQREILSRMTEHQKESTIAARDMHKLIQSWIAKAG